MESLSFVVETTPQTFSTWLETKTLMLPNERFQTENGYISLERPRVSGDQRHLSISGVYVIQNEGRGSDKAYVLDDIIQFDMVPQSTEKTEIAARYSGGLLVPDCFSALLNEVARHWPEASTAIVQYQLGMTSADHRKRRSGDKTFIPSADDKEVFVPVRPKDLQRWRVTWTMIRENYMRGETYESMLARLTRRKMPTTEDTLRKILRAGDLGRLS